MPRAKRKSAPQRLTPAEQEERERDARNVLPPLPPAVADQLAVVLEGFAQEEEAQIDKEIIAAAGKKKKKRYAKHPVVVRLRSGTPGIHLCSFANLPRIGQPQTLNTAQTLRIRSDAAQMRFFSDGAEGIPVSEAPKELLQDLQASRALSTLVNAGRVSLMPVILDTGNLTVNVMLNKEAIEEEETLDDASERPLNCELRLLFAIAMRVRGDSSFEQYAPRRNRSAAKSVLSPDAVQKIFGAAAPLADSPALPSRPHGLMLPLRKYQLQAVEWMRRRETCVASFAHPLWQEIEDDSIPGQRFLYNRCIGRVKPQQEIPQLRDIAGGILCDEMGLGKTLEVIALLLARPSALSRPEAYKAVQHVACVCGVTVDDGDSMVQCEECKRWQHCACVEFEPLAAFYCAACIAFVSQPPVECRATLIICPAAILSQWQDEIRKHTAPGALQVTVYHSVRDKGRLTHPRKLLTADVVLTTYETLRQDLTHVQDGNRGRDMRQKRRFPALPTPLDHIHWHRVVLDECQLVEGSNAAAEMARQLVATHRWTVSGTPLGNSLDDLFGLLRFLHVQPYGERVWWQRALAAPFECNTEAPLLGVVKRLMWRNTKASVADQLEIPAQHEQVSTLRFREVESYWYKKQYDEACFRANELLSLADRRGSLTSKQRSNMLLPLLQLRQACCHPQVGAHGIRSLKKNPMTMDELLATLIEKAKVEALEAQRGMLSAINGTAALYLCQSDTDKAVETYRECLMIMSANQDELPVDRLQRMHCLHNLAFAVAQQARLQGTLESGGVALQLRRLEEEEQGLRQDYVRDRLNRVTSQLIKSDALTQETKAALDRFSLEWLLTAVRKAGSHEELLLTLVRDTLAHGGNVGKVSLRRLPAYRNLTGLQLVVVNEIDALMKARRTFLSALAGLGGAMTPAEVAEASNCSRCRKKKGPVCKHCAVLPLMEAYQQRLYIVLREAEKDEGEGEEQLLQLESDGGVKRRAELQIQKSSSDAETVLKLVHGYVRHHLKEEMGEEMLAQADDSMQALQMMKKELDAAQALWRYRGDYVAAVDEVDMCVMRISLVPDNDFVPESERHYRIHMNEIAAMHQKLMSDRLRSANELSHAQRQLAYLRQITPHTTAAAECPVCHEPVGQRRVLFPCGHVFCSDCVVQLMRHSHSLTTVKCPSCREIINKEEVSYVQDDAPPVLEKRPDVRGSYGTKIEAIVGTLLSIAKAEPLAKSIVFSEWTDVLRIVANALRENDIPFLEIKSKKDFEGTIGTFKTSPAIRVLLMTTKQGANGLNLIEATNVLLVEPLLNPAVENQAINRVHRIGQTHETRVFRFIVNATVEERIFSYNRKRSAAAAGEVNLKRKSTEAEIGIDNMAELLGLGEARAAARSAEL